ncbi:MAG: aminotransferase class I/II-fold pyridoxal phosphate-dependent enzyme [Acidobacteriota bacterium]
MSLDDDARDELRRLEAAHRLRVPRVVDGRQGAHVVLDGQRVLNLASNDYLGLAGDPRLARAAAEAAASDGVGAGASRLIVGNHRRHVSLERALASWLEVPAARLFNSGYAANVGVLTALLGADDVVFSDELNHASIIDGCRLSRARVVVFAHRDVGALERALSTCPGRRRIVVTETLFSMDGDLADVATLADLCRHHDAALMLDEAHALGVRGPSGRGVAAAAGVVPDLLVGTLGKALGGFGAFVATTPAIAELLWNRARSLVFSTALPPLVCAAAERAVEIARGSEGDERRATLGSLARLVRRKLAGTRGALDSAIVPVIVGDDREVMAITARALDHGVFVQGIRPPTVPEGTSRLRIAISARLTPEELEKAVKVLDDAARRST